MRKEMKTGGGGGGGGGGSRRRLTRSGGSPRAIRLRGMKTKEVMLKSQGTRGGGFPAEEKAGGCEDSIGEGKKGIVGGRNPGSGRSQENKSAAKMVGGKRCGNESMQIQGRRKGGDHNV